MDLDAGAVDEQPIGRVLLAGQRAEDPFPNPTLGPAHEAIVERLLRSIDIARAVGPAPATPERVDDPAQHPAIVDTVHAANILRQQRLDPSPLRIRKPKEISHLQRLPSETLNYTPPNNGIQLMGPDPSHYKR